MTSASACRCGPAGCATVKSGKCWVWPRPRWLTPWNARSRNWQGNAMCEFSEKLIAWLDHELAVEASAAFERHVRGCAECLRAAEAYRTLNQAIEAYCETAILAA